MITASSAASWVFDTDPLIGAGLPYWLPDGPVVRHTFTCELCGCGTALFG
jgi:hypothetical protein